MLKSPIPTLKFLLLILFLNLSVLSCNSDDDSDTAGADPLMDQDADGVINQLEDIDGDGDFSNDDTDGDGIPNYLDSDDDGDGIATISEDIDGDGDFSNDDTDSDEIPNYLDSDDDGDGVATINEDVNGDGNPLNDDSDEDDIPNYLDMDDDGDGIATINEDLNGDGDPMNDDSDLDGTANYLDIVDDSICTQDSFLFSEQGGIVIMEMEDVPNLTDIGDWEYKTNNLTQQNGSAFDTSFSGDGYLYYNGNQSFTIGGNSIVEYRIEINTPGTYRFVYASAIGIFADSNPGTEHNDSWVKFPDADAFFGYKSEDNTIAIPNNVGLNGPNPNDSALDAAYPGATYKFPNGSNSQNNGFFKVFMNRLDDWWYEGKTSDSDAHDIMVRFDNPGTYTFQISGRSSGFAIDRAVLWIEQGTLEDLESAAERKDAFRGLASAVANCQ